MSLDFTINKIEDWENICYLDDGQLNPLTNAVIFGTMFVGIRNITAENWMEFYARISMYEIAFGSMVGDQNGPVYLTPQDVKMHIGISTNAESLSETQFRNNFYQGFHRNQLDVAKKVELDV